MGRIDTFLVIVAKMASIYTLVLALRLCHLKVQLQLQHLHELSYKLQDWLLLLYYAFKSHQQLRPYRDRYRTGKNRFNTLILFFINSVGRVISLDCQYIIRVAEENCYNCSLLPKSDNDRLLYIPHVQYKGLL